MGGKDSFVCSRASSRAIKERGRWTVVNNPPFFQLDDAIEYFHAQRTSTRIDESKFRFVTQDVADEPCRFSLAQLQEGIVN